MSLPRGQLDKTIFSSVTPSYQGLFQPGESAVEKGMHASHFEEKKECDRKWSEAFARLPTTSKKQYSEGAPIADHMLFVQAVSFGTCLVTLLRDSGKLTQEIFEQFYLNIQTISNYQLTENKHFQHHLQKEKVYKIRQLVLCVYEQIKPSQYEILKIYAFIDTSIHNALARDKNNTLVRVDYLDILPRSVPMSPDLEAVPTQEAINNTYKKLLLITTQYCNYHLLTAPDKAAVFAKLIFALEDKVEVNKYERIKNFVKILKEEDKNILNQHRHTGRRYLANVLSILLAGIPALCRALHSYYKLGTPCFWKPESEKVKDCAIRECEKINIRMP